MRRRVWSPRRSPKRLRSGRACHSHDPTAFQVLVTTSRHVVRFLRGARRETAVFDLLEMLARVLAGEPDPGVFDLNHGQRSSGTRGLSATIAIVLHCFLNTRVS